MVYDVWYVVQLCSSCVCSLSLNLSVKVIVQCVSSCYYMHLTIYIHRVRRRGSSWWNIAFSVTPITVGINNNIKNCINYLLFFVFLVITTCM